MERGVRNPQRTTSACLKVPSVALLTLTVCSHSIRSECSPWLVLCITLSLSILGGGYEMGRQRRGYGRSHDHKSVHAGDWKLPEGIHGSQLHREFSSLALFFLLFISMLVYWYFDFFFYSVPGIILGMYVQLLAQVMFVDLYKKKNNMTYNITKCLTFKRSDS